MRITIPSILLFSILAGAATSTRAQTVKLTPTTVIGGSPASGTVTLASPAKGDTTIKLYSDNEAAATVPASVKIADKKTTSDPFQITTFAVPSKATANISAYPAESMIKPASLQITPPFTNKAPIAQTLVGLDVAGASSTSPAAVFLALAGMDVPFKKADLKDPTHKGDGDLTDARHFVFWGGGMLKVAGMAQPGNISQLSSVTSYVASAVNSTPDKIVQSMDGSAFAALQFDKWPVPGGTFDAGAIPMGMTPVDTYITASFIVSGGGITPLSLSQANPQIYISTTQIQQQFPTLPTSCTTTGSTSTTCYVAFVPNDRTRFYHHYEAGLRFKLYAPDYDDYKFRYPGTIDITAGQNEYVTGGQLKGVVVHIGGTLPIPYLDGFYAFGNMDMAMSPVPPGTANQLLLTPAPSKANLTLTSSSVTLVPVTQPNRDRYSLGFGIDFWHIYNSFEKKKQKQQ